MPIYEYQCSECGHQQEALQKMSDAPLTDCPACGQVALKKQISLAGFRLKGTGWYETDFKGGSSSDSGTKGGSDSGGDAKKGSSSSSSSDSGTKTKTKTKTSASSSSAGDSGGG